MIRQVALSLAFVVLVSTLSPTFSCSISEMASPAVAETYDGQVIFEISISCQGWLRSRIDILILWN